MDHCLCCAKAFYLDEVPIVHLCFCFSAFGDVSSKKLLQLRSKRLLPVFSSRVLMVSCLSFRSFIHFEFIFVYGVRRWFSFILLHVAVQFFLHHLLKRLCFFHWIFFPALSKISWPYFCGSILGFLFYSIGLCVCFCAKAMLS